MDHRGSRPRQKTTCGVFSIALNTMKFPGSTGGRSWSRQRPFPRGQATLRRQYFLAMECTRRFSEWLMKNPPDFLPFFQQEKCACVHAASCGSAGEAPEQRCGTRTHAAPSRSGTCRQGRIRIASQYDATLYVFSNVRSVTLSEKTPKAVAARIRATQIKTVPHGQASPGKIPQQHTASRNTPFTEQPKTRPLRELVCAFPVPAARQEQLEHAPVLFSGGERRYGKRQVTIWKLRTDGDSTFPLYALNAQNGDGKHFSDCHEKLDISRRTLPVYPAIHRQMQCR